MTITPIASELLQTHNGYLCLCEIFLFFRFVGKGGTDASLVVLLQIWINLLMMRISTATIMTIKYLSKK